MFLLRANRRTVLTAMLVSVISGVASAGIIALTHKIWEGQLFTSAIWIWRFVGVLAVLMVSGVACQLMVLNLAMKAVADLRLELSAKILSTPLQRLEALGLAKLLPVLTDDVTAVSKVLPNVPRLVVDGTTLLAGAAYMAYLSWKAMLVLMVFIVIGVAIYRVLTLRSMGFMREGRNAFDLIFEHFRALHDGIKQLKLNALRRKTFLKNDLHGALDHYRVTNTSGRKMFIAAENLTRLVFFVLLGMLIFVVPRMGIETGVLDGYVLMALFLYRPLGTLMQQAPDLGRAAVSLQKIEQLGLSLGEDPVDLEAPVPPIPVSWKSLELRGVKYSYTKDADGNIFKLGPVNLKFVPGELVFVLGGNGSGKTTLAKVLTSLYPLEGGEILMDGVPVDESNVDDYRQLFSIVFTDFHLFRSLQAREGVDVDAAALEHLRRLQLDHKLSVAGGQLSNVDLSQGQRKRLALLSAYLEDRPFYVLDEWAADQDPQFKNTFYREVLPELKAQGKTVLVITHDDRYMDMADRCLKLEDGLVLPQTDDEISRARDAAGSHP